jgi:hypothetical protein
LPPIGILLVVEREGVLGDIVRGILAQDAALTLLAERDDGAAVAAQVANTGAEAVVWIGGERSPTGEAFALLRRHPQLRILTVEGDGRSGFLFSMQPHREPLGELSPAALVAALRR